MAFGGRALRPREKWSAASAALDFDPGLDRVLRFKQQSTALWATYLVHILGSTTLITCPVPREAAGVSIVLHALGARLASFPRLERLQALWATRPYEPGGRRVIR